MISSKAGRISADKPLFSERDVAQYRERGYVVAEGVLGEDTLRRARAALAEFIDGSRGLTQSNAVYDLEPTHRSDAPAVRRMKQPHRLYPIFFEIARLPTLVAALVQLLGPAVRYQASKLNLKAPHGGTPIEWHQDWAFYPHTNDDLLAVGVMMEDCSSESGPLLVIPGTHRGPIYNHHSGGYFCGAIDPAQLGDKPQEAVALTGPAGSMSFHHVRLVHGSAQNTSAAPRPLLLYQYSAGDAWPLDGISLDYGKFDLAKFDAGLLSGEPNIEPRFAQVPVRMPLPPPPQNGSIFERQAMAAHRYFDVKHSH